MRTKVERRSTFTCSLGVGIVRRLVSERQFEKPMGVPAVIHHLFPALEMVQMLETGNSPCHHKTIGAGLSFVALAGI